MKLNKRRAVLKRKPVNGFKTSDTSQEKHRLNLKYVETFT